MQQETKDLICLRYLDAVEVNALITNLQPLLDGLNNIQTEQRNTMELTKEIFKTEGITIDKEEANKRLGIGARKAQEIITYVFDKIDNP